MMKKIIAILLALLMLLCVTACGKQDPDAPDNMKSATVPGEPFRLYVPESFKVLIKELQSLGLDFKLLSKDMEEIDLKETFEDDDDDIYDDKFRKKAESGVGADEVFESTEDEAEAESEEEYEEVEEDIDDSILEDESDGWDDEAEEDTSLYIDSDDIDED